METATPCPDFSATMMQREREKLFTVALGEHEQGTPVIAVLPDVSPLLILHGEGDLHKRLICALLMQWYAKIWASTLRFVLIERQKDLKLVPLFATHPCTTLVARSTSGRQEALCFLEEELEQRTHHPKVAPQWLIVLELDEALQRQEGAWRAYEKLLTQRHTCGLFCIVIAGEKIASTLLLANVFACTIKMTPTSMRPNAHSATLARQASANACVSIGIPPIEPRRLLEKLLQLDLELGREMSVERHAADGTRVP